MTLLAPAGFPGMLRRFHMACSATALVGIVACSPGTDWNPPSIENEMLQVNLESDVSYLWRVRALSGQAPGAWSTTLQFEKNNSDNEIYDVSHVSTIGLLEDELYPYMVNEDDSSAQSSILLETADFSGLPMFSWKYDHNALAYEIEVLQTDTRKRVGVFQFPEASICTEGNCQIVLHNTRDNSLDLPPIRLIGGSLVEGEAPYTVNLPSPVIDIEQLSTYEHTWSVEGKYQEFTNTPEFQYTFSEAGTYMVNVLVSSADGRVEYAYSTVNISEPPSDSSKEVSNSVPSDEREPSHLFAALPATLEPDKSFELNELPAPVVSVSEPDLGEPVVAEAASHITTNTTHLSKSNSVEVSWGLFERATGQIEWGFGEDILDRRTVKEVSFNHSSHLQIISGLTPSTTIFYKVVGETISGSTYSSMVRSVTTAKSVVGNGQEPPELFTSPQALSVSGSQEYQGLSTAPQVLSINEGQEPPELLTAPQVSSGSGATSSRTIEPIADATENSVEVSWEVSEVATGQLEWGYSESSLDHRTVKETSFNYSRHVQTISGLTSSETIFYRVVGETISGSTYSSDVRSVSTEASVADNGLAPPVLLAALPDSFEGGAPTHITINPVGEATANSVKVSWALSEAATGQLEWGFWADRLDQRTVKDSSFTHSSHQQTITGLEPSTEIYYRSVGETISGSTYSSDVRSVITAESVASDEWDDSMPLGGRAIGVTTSGITTGNTSLVAHKLSRRFLATRSGSVKGFGFLNRVLTAGDIERRAVSKRESEPVWYEIQQAFGNDPKRGGYMLANSYSVGNGGLQEVTLQTDSGAPDHLPSGNVIATGIPFVPFDKPLEKIVHIDFEQPGNVQAGLIYHLVFNNLNPPPSGTQLHNMTAAEAADAPIDSGAIALDGVKNGPAIDAIDRFGPFHRDIPVTLFKKSDSSGWSTSDVNAFFSLVYTDDIEVGEMYAHIHGQSAYRYNVDGNEQLRQEFTWNYPDIMVDRIVTRFGHSENANGQSLNIVVRNQSSTPIATASVSFDIELKNVASSSSWLARHQTRHAVSYLSNTVQLETGQTYYIQYSAPSGAGYVMSPALDSNLRHGTNDSNIWDNAMSMQSADGGSSWQYLRAFPTSDLPMYFIPVGVSTLTPLP